MSEMTPQQIVAELDKHIIGQDEAKRAVAIALRNRWRRMQVGEGLRAEITPKNILMIGPTGVGKTEIARRLAKLANAPFLKVEATKFTEVGYVGREVDSIIRDLVDEEASKMINEEELKIEAVKNVEENGIVFLDELDKVARRSETQGADVSREGVQRDLLPLVEGCTVTTKYGMVRTDHVLFIASGAFHFSKPSDLIPELQGRFPIRVELDALTTDEFIRILQEPDCSLTEQYTALMATESVGLDFSESGIRRIAEIAFQVNERSENIGARRLHTVLERLLEAVSFEAADREGQSITVDAGYVDSHLGELVKDEDLTRYIL